MERSTAIAPPSRVSTGGVPRYGRSAERSWACRSPRRSSGRSSSAAVAMIAPEVTKSAAFFDLIAATAERVEEIVVGAIE